MTGFSAEDDHAECDTKDINSVKPSKARLKRRKFLATLPIRQFSMEPDVEIDLTTDEVVAYFS